jgi:ADP-ribose pyrophosphatase
MQNPWTVLGKRTVYDSDWVRLHHLDLALPDGQTARGWHLIDFPRQAAGIIPVGDDGRILMIDHYRFATEHRSWETPGGRIEEGETGLEAAHRELREETGHAAAEMRFIGAYFPSCGSSNQVFNVFVATGVTKVGSFTDVNEVIGLRWFTPDEIRAMIGRNEIREGMTLTGLLWYFLNR